MKRRSKRIADLEVRVADLEKRLEDRDWSASVIPRNTIEKVDLPTLPDYSAGFDEDGPDDVWNPLSYL